MLKSLLEYEVGWLCDQILWNKYKNVLSYKKYFEYVIFGMEFDWCMELLIIKKKLKRFNFII